MLKEYLSNPPMLSKPISNKSFWLFITVHNRQYTTRKKNFNGGYLVEVDITLGIDLINRGFLPSSSSKGY